MEHPPIPYARQSMSPEDLDGVLTTLESPFLTTGPEVSRFEAALCDLTGAGHAVACANGTAALHLACLALGISGGDTGLTSPNSFLASANCIEYCGGSADFIDIHPRTLNLDPAGLEAWCRENSRPKVVIPVDFAGTPADLPAIHALSGEFGFRIIEDAAHALGSTYRHEGRVYQCGSCAHSDMAIFSFHPAKTVTCGEGGAVMTNDDDLAMKLRTLRTHGMVRGTGPDRPTDSPWYYEMAELGYNFRITDFQCALGTSQLKRLKAFKERRIQIVNLYNNAFKHDDRLILPPQALSDQACPHLYPIQFTGGSETRKKVYLGLADHNIFCQVHYIPIYWQPYYAKKYGYARGKCPNAETYYNRALSLPLFPSLTDKQAELVIQTLKSLL